MEAISSPYDYNDPSLSESGLKEIRVKDAPQAIGKGDSFKAGDFAGLLWKSDSSLYPIARRIESMPENERDILKLAIDSSQISPDQYDKDPSKGLYYLVSSYGVPIAWLTNNGEIFRTGVRYSEATAKHVTLALQGLNLLVAKLKLNIS